MDKDTARTLAVAAIKSSSMLTNLLPDLKQRCRAEEYEELRRAISAVAGDIRVEELQRIFRAHPVLEGELEEAIRASGSMN